MRLAAGIVAAIGLFAAALPLSAAGEQDGWYIYWDDNVILGGPFPSEEICKMAMRDKRHVPHDALCQVILYRDGVPINGTQKDLSRPPPKPHI